MKIISKTPQESLDKHLLRFRPKEAEFERFKTGLSELTGKIDEAEREDNQEIHVQNFLRDVFYRGISEVNKKKDIDLAIHLTADKASPVGVIIETKRPGNKAEMLSAGNPNTKALHELVLYFMRERVDEKNDDIRYLVATNINEWFIFSASDFNRHFCDNKKFRKEYEAWRDDLKVSSNTPHFYTEIAKPYIDSLDETLECTHFDLCEYPKAGVKKLIALYKLLSPYHLLKTRFEDDSNTLDRKFYTELLHIIGLEEYKEKSKTLIRRKTTDNTGSLLEMTVTMLETKDVLSRVENPSAYGDTSEKRYETIALELCITWINRILFLKLLEAQLVGYHEGDKAYHFLNLETVRDFDELFALFHQVLAKTADERKAAIKDKYARVPYLNSSLFEPTDLENETITIESLKDHEELPLIASSILKKLGEKAAGLRTLEYLFRFLDAYDFASEGKEDIQSENRSLINASVLGKVFEKINGYKDGSIYTPGFITMYMCRQAIRLAVVQKFKDESDFDGADFDELSNWIKSRNYQKDNIKRFNEIIDSLKICDPAVGSGHFLVSALNEMLSIKSELGIFADEDHRTFSDYSIAIANDELIITDRENNLFEYKIRDGKPLNAEMQRLQSALFHEKQKLIENCLFGVDINPNSVKICRLRLWIELLKNAYYKGTELETLPNIDINIKEGNSLISRYELYDKFKTKKTSEIIAAYRAFTAESKNVKNRFRKEELKQHIKELRRSLSSSLDDETTKKKEELVKKQARLSQFQNPELFDKYTDYARETKSKALTAEIEKAQTELQKIELKYADAFEWRFEFPEVLDDGGGFLGFDIVIGNPPYIRQEALGELKKHLKQRYQVFSGTADILVYFYEVGLRVLKENGSFSFITSNKFMRANFGEATRGFLSKFNLSEIIDFGDAPVFGGIAAYASIVNLQKRIPEKNHQTRVFTFPREGDVPDFETAYDTDSFTIPQKEFTSDTWRLERMDILDLLAKLKSKGKPLGKYINASMYFGIKTGLNEAFVVDRATRDRLITEDPTAAFLFVRFLRGRDVSRWEISFEDTYLIKIESSGNKKHPWSGFKSKAAEAKFEETYPTIFEHFQPFRDRLINRDDQGTYYWELRACAYWDEFCRTKLIYPDIYQHQSFAWDELGYFAGNTCYFIPTDEKWLTALLNSKTVEFFYSQLSMKMLGGYMRSFSDYMEQIPIPVITSDKQAPFTTLVDQILDLKKSGGDTTALERQIDDMVYELYELTPDEIAIVEGA